MSIPNNLIKNEVLPLLYAYGDLNSCGKFKKIIGDV